MALLHAAIATACLSVLPLTTPAMPISLSAPLWSPPFYARPATMAMDENGTAIVAIRGKRDSRGPVRVVMANGNAKLFAFPADATLYVQITATVVDSKGRPQFDIAQIESVGLQGGTPIITVSMPFEGAYSGLEEASYVWTRTGWAGLFSHYGNHNGWIAATTATSTVFGLDDLAALGTYVAEHANLQQQAIGAAVHTEHQNTIVNDIRPTRIRGTTLAGYILPQGIYKETGPPKGVLWHNGKFSDVGTGLVWSANGDGYAVGDNRRTPTSLGNPTVFFGGTQRVLTSKPGAVFDISTAGIAVGAIGDAAFAYNVWAPNNGVMYLSDLVTDRAWRVHAAYYISENGNILALASRNGHDLQAVILHFSAQAPACATLRRPRPL